MTRFETIMAVLNLVAIVGIPILAVVIGQYLQNRAEKRKDKMQIFRILMTSRIYGWTVDSVHALNLIDVVFAKDTAVRDAWKNLLDAYSSSEESELMKQKRQNLNYKLLEEMAKNLGYKDRITWETIQNPYVPRGMIDQWETQARSQQAYNDLLHSITSIMPKEESKEVTK